MRRLILAWAAAAGALASVGAADDSVATSLTVREAPDAATLFLADATIGNGFGSWRLSLANRRAHGDRGRHLKFGLSNGQPFGFSGLIDAVKLTVNGIPWNRLQVRPKHVRTWAENGREGLSFALNFDGAPVRIRASMAPGSPWLDFEVKPSAKGLAPVTNLVVSVSAIPSFLDCGHGRPTRFDKYRRTVRTATRILPPQKGGAVPLRPDDGYVVFMDADYDGSDDGKGMGPCAVRMSGPVAGEIGLNDGWTTSVTFRPDPAKALGFSLLEYPNRRIRNEDFAALLRK